jgi:hypothetical protein
VGKIARSPGVLGVGEQQVYKLIVIDFLIGLAGWSRSETLRLPGAQKRDSNGDDGLHVSLVALDEGMMLVGA